MRLERQKKPYLHPVSWNLLELTGGSEVLLLVKTWLVGACKRSHRIKHSFIIPVGSGHLLCCNCNFMRTLYEVEKILADLVCVYLSGGAVRNINAKILICILSAVISDPDHSKYKIEFKVKHMKSLTNGPIL